MDYDHFDPQELCSMNSSLVVPPLPITCLVSSLPVVQFAPVEAALLHPKQRDPYLPEIIDT